MARSVPKTRDYTTSVGRMPVVRLNLVEPVLSQLLGRLPGRDGVFAAGGTARARRRIAPSQASAQGCRFRDAPSHLASRSRRIASTLTCGNTAGEAPNAGDEGARVDARYRMLGAANRLCRAKQVHLFDCEARERLGLPKCAFPIITGCTGNPSFRLHVMSEFGRRVYMRLIFYQPLGS